MPEHPHGWLSLLPPLISIVLAIATRRVLISLMLGTLSGAIILYRGQIGTIIPHWFEVHLWSSLVDESHLRVFAFTLLMGAMVGLIHRSGGMHGVVEKLAPLARGRRSGQFTTWLMGLVVFFDDYANTLLLGGTMQPLADRLKISREKLSYLVDSTAAPVAGLALVSTWVAGEIGFIQAGLENAQATASTEAAFGLFVASIPYRFYVLWALAFVAIVSLTNRDFGPMLRAERRVAEVASDEKHSPDTASVHASPADPKAKVPHRWHNAVIPVAAVVGVTFWLLVETGRQSAGASDPSMTWFHAISHGDSYLSLAYGSLCGWLVAVVWIGGQRILPLDEIRSASFEGAKTMLPALTILWLAWTLSTMTNAPYLNTGEYLAGMIEGNVSVTWMPTIVFLLASVVAFSTGTSWGTMGILMPLVIRVTLRVLDSGELDGGIEHPVFIASVGSVLAGAIFGDHCSPISDTTILSSQASGCDHIAHVRTQLPYAGLVGGVAIVCGTVPVGFGWPVFVVLPLGLVVLLASIFVLGRCPQAQDS